MRRFLNLSLRGRLLLVSSAVLIFTVLTLIIISYNLNYKRAITNYKEIQHRIAVTTSKIVEASLDQYQEGIKLFANSLIIDDTKDTYKVYGNYIETTLKDLKLLNLVIAYENGEFYTNKAVNIGSDYNILEQEWFKNSINSTGFMMSKAYIDANLKIPVITVTYPVKTINGTKGVVVFDIALDFKDLFSSTSSKTVDGKFYILESDGIVVSAIDDSILLKNSTDVFSEILTDYIGEIVKGTKSSETEAYYSNKNDHRMGVVYKIPGYDLLLLYGISVDKIQESAGKVAIMSFVVGGILLTISIIIVLAAINFNLKELKAFQRQITEVANSNDLTRKITSRTNDELGQIAEAVNMFISSMGNIINEVRSSIIEVASANDELAATMEELSATFSSQSSQVSDMVDSMGEVSEVSRNTSDALAVNMQSLEDTANATRVETEKLDKVSQEMGLIEQDTVELSENIRSLSASSAEIGNILGVINDIANQTNLLALNAAIEAARAGEAGRGFAVVADEVRKLAERTQDATKEIENIIGTLQRETETATQAMDKSVESVHTGTENIRNVTEEIKRAVENVTHLYTDMRPVADSVANQYGTVQNVVDNARSISAGIDESNSAVNEVNNTVSHLQRRTDLLKQLIEQFKV